MNGRHLLAAFLLLALAAAPTGAAAEQIPASRLQSLPDADIVILGELHDNPYHHANQAAATAAIAPAALVFEMLTPELAARAAGIDRSDAGALAQALSWEARGWPDFEMYHPIFEAAPQARIFGGDLPRSEIRRALDEGAEAIFAARHGVQAAQVWGLDRPLPPEQQAERENAQARAHCDAMPEDLLPGMVAAQRLRDAVLAHSVTLAHAQTGGPVVLITGNGHARTDRGVPRKLARGAPSLGVLAIGQLESEPDSEPPYDLWLVTPGIERGDPCAAFE